MSTRAGIGMLMPDWTIHAVYLHHDGYLFGGAGEILAKHYTTPERVESLLELGDLSSLKPNIYPDVKISHSWSNPQPNVTVAYHRDRNDPLVPAVKVMNKESFPEQAKELWAEYAHLFEDGHWLVCDLHLSAKPWKWKVLSDVLAQTGWKLNGKPVDV